MVNSVYIQSHIMLHATCEKDVRACKPLHPSRVSVDQDVHVITLMLHTRWDIKEKRPPIHRDILEGECA
jgi:hypothetical protein